MSGADTVACQAWIKNPQSRSLTKDEFKGLIQSCRQLLTLDDLKEADPALSALIFPDRGRSAEIKAIISALGPVSDRYQFTTSQLDYLNLLILKLKTYEPLCSLLQRDRDCLARLLVQGLIINDAKGYGPEAINSTFTDFFLPRGYQVTLR